MASQISEFRGLRSNSAHARFGCRGLASVAFTVQRSGRTRLTVESYKKMNKKKQIVLLEDVEKLGKGGDLVTVAMGYWRNYLEPNNKAKAATAEILADIQAKKDAEEREKEEIKDRATRLAVALQTIGRFVIKKKSAKEGAIFGSVTAQEVVDAIYQQTGQQIDKRNLSLPEIKEVGTYEAAVKLHPEVTGAFKIIVEREKSSARG